MKKRYAKIARSTRETTIKGWVDLDGTGQSSIKTGIGFFDHMLTTLAKHASIDMRIRVKGDLAVDEHHTVEDAGIAIGTALYRALGDKRGIERFGSFAPMDETLAKAVIDLGGRPYLVWNVVFKRAIIGDFPTELFEDFFRALSDNLKANIHINLCYGRNEHHLAEAIFKSFARALKMAACYDAKNLNTLPSTKGII